MNLYERLPVDNETPVQFVGVYVTHWRPEWGRPGVAFRESEAVPAMYGACQEGLSFMESVIEFNEMRGNTTPPDVVELRDRFAAALAAARGES